MARKSTAAITINVYGADKILLDLERRSGQQLNATLKKATKAAATAVKPFLVAAAPRRTGKTARSISVRARRGQVGSSVGPRIWYRHFPIVGTSRGIKPNPWVARGVQAGLPVARAAMESVVKTDIQR